MNNRKEYMKKYHQEHKEAFRIAAQKYRDKDRKKYNEHDSEYRKRKRKEAKENAELVIKQKEVLDKIKEIPLKHIDNANEELQIILRNNNDLEYKNQCSHDFEIIRQNVELIYNEILELLEEIE